MPLNGPERRTREAPIVVEPSPKLGIDLPGKLLVDCPPAMQLPSSDLVPERLWAPPASPAYRVGLSTSRRVGRPSASGLTITRAEHQPAQTSDSNAHKTRSAAVIFGLFTERWSTPSWWRQSEDLDLEGCSAAERSPKEREERCKHESGRESARRGQRALYQADPSLREPQYPKRRF
jgi:hypothetical protein